MPFSSSRAPCATAALAVAAGLGATAMLRGGIAPSAVPPTPTQRVAGAPGAGAAGAAIDMGPAPRPYRTVAAATMAVAAVATAASGGARRRGAHRRAQDRRRTPASPFAGARHARRSATAVQSQVVSGLAEGGCDQLFVVSCYTRFDNLAHGPRGKEAKRSLYTFRLDRSDGQMVLESVSTETVMNPAFSRAHPTKDLLYTCTESVAEPGEIVTWAVDHETGKLTKLSSISAGGTSTCYLTLDKGAENMLVVNYWDATVGVFGVDPQSGILTAARSFYDSNEGRPMRARHDKHVNHSENDASAQEERQADPHAHAVILDKFSGRIAYVPDLGMDIIRQFVYDPEASKLEPAGTVKSGPEGRKALGPRYIEFHPELPFAYVVNELSSEVSVFEFDKQAAKDLVAYGANTERPTLRLVQTVRTIPAAWPGDNNTCGRITVHAAGDFVLVSNRGHDSIAVFRVERGPVNTGHLTQAGMHHTRGATPRHFQFDKSGEWLVSANQDSDKVAVFKFDLSSGSLEWTGNDYTVPSPNFVCSVTPHTP